jgi:tetratricopeptide (TPR) repeat protein
MVFHGILGDIYTSRMQIEEAVAYYDEIIKIDPDFVYAYYKKGEAQKLMLGMVEDAIKSFEKCLELGYRDASVYYNLGFCYKIFFEHNQNNNFTRTQQLNLAIENFEKSIAIDPNNAYVYYNLGDIYFNLELYAEALTNYSKAHELIPDSAIILTRLTHTYYEVGQTERAIELFNKSLKLISDQEKQANLSVQTMYLLEESKVANHLYLAEAYMKLNQKDKAKKEYKTVIGLTEQRGGRKLTQSMSMYRDKAEEILKQLAP